MHRPRVRAAAVGPILAVFLVACGGAPQVAPALPPVAVTAPTPTPSASPPPPTGAPTAPATTAQVPGAPGCVTAKELAALPIRTQLAQLLMVGVDPAGTGQATDVVAQGVGGIFVGGDATGLLTSGVLQRLQDTSRFGLMVAADEEGGRVQRIDGLAGSLPSARVMAATMTAQQVHDLAYNRGLALRKYGINVDLAPDADVSGQPNNTVIGDRSFSANSAVVTTYADAVASGLRAAKVMPVLKHFPGHGEASGDSHQGAVSTAPLVTLQRRDLVPFRQLVSSGVGVMLGHLDVPGLTEPGVPASLSPAAIGLLRQGTGYGATPFDGVVFTDDLGGMAAVTAKYDVPVAVLDALAAGADVALFITTSRLPAVLDYLQQAVAEHRLPSSRVQDSLRRVLTAKNVPLC